MGADIHLYSESKVEGQWLCDQAASLHWETTEFGSGEQYSYPVMDSPYINRNYHLFGALALVRTEWEFSQEPRGLPEDISAEVSEMADHWKDDGHSHSYWSVTELKALATRLMVQTEDTDGHATSGVLRGLQDILQGLPAPPEGTTDQRIVFWFDN